MIRQQLEQRQQQRFSALQIMQTKMLELTTLELEDRITRELEENPALEEMGEHQPASAEEDPSEEYGFDGGDGGTNDDFSLGDYRTEDDIPDYKLQQNNYSRDDRRDEIPFSEEESLQQSLLTQLRLRELSDTEQQIGEFLIGNLDDDGYLRRSLGSVSDDLAFLQGMTVSVEEIENVLKVVQELDPPGIGARDLQECLLLQLERMGKTRIQQLAIIVIRDFFDAFSKKFYPQIIRTLNISEEEMRDVVKEIKLLSPRPGSSWESGLVSKLSEVTPDFIVEAVDGELILSMAQDSIPELRVNPEYLDMFDDYVKNKKNQTRERKDALTFVKQKLDSAKWFIDALRQRQNTLRDTMLAIIRIQKQFFLTGEEADLKPMILKDVALLCGYDISTISRVSNSKYVQTNFGIYSLKYFFSESMVNEEGEEISTREVKSILKKCIDEEEKSKPLTDEALVAALKEKGYEIARRTVAKYREQLGVPVARLRKEI